MNFMSQHPASNETDINTLRSIAELEPVTIAQLSKHFDLTLNTTRSRVRQVISKGYATRTELPEADEYTLTRYVIEMLPKGRKLLNPAAPVTVSPDPRRVKPQQQSFHGTFYVPPSFESVRPGADDHLKYKSLGF